MFNHLYGGTRVHVGGTSSGTWCAIGTMGTIIEHKLGDSDRFVHMKADSGTIYSLEHSEVVIGTFAPKVYDTVEIIGHWGDPMNKIENGMVGLILDRKPMYYEDTHEQAWFVCVPEMIAQKSRNNGLYWLYESEFVKYAQS